MSSDKIKAQKKSVRKFYLQRRMEISETQIVTSNASIFEKVIHLKEFEEADVIHIYASMNDRNEVDTFSIIDYAIKNGKQVIVPVMKESGILYHCKLNSTNSLKKNSWGVPEPIGSKPVEEANADIIFVPMVAGDLQKNRLGYGKGYYDRFLASAKSIKAGLLFEKQLSSELIPTDSYDVPLDILITEKRVLR